MIVNKIFIFKDFRFSEGRSQVIEERVRGLSERFPTLTCLVEEGKTTVLAKCREVITSTLIWMIILMFRL